LDLRDLAYFQAIVEAGHIGRAAEKVGRTQPALTKSVRRLEADIGAELFERSGRGLRLTSVGEVLFARTRQLRNAVDMTLRELGDVARGEVGHVRVGSAATTAEYLLPSLFGRLLKETPKVTIELAIGMNDVLRASLRAGKLDLVIGPLTESDSEFASVALMEDKVVVVARENHPAAQGAARLEDMTRYRWVLPGPSVAMRQWLENVFVTRGFDPPDVQIETSSMTLLPKIIAQTDLLSFISARNLGRGRVGEPLVEICLPETTMFRRLGVLYRRDSYLSPAAHRLIDLVKMNADSSAANLAALEP
jgi:DNA-binding transcriptional LysR family regulator